MMQPLRQWFQLGRSFIAVLVAIALVVMSPRMAQAMPNPNAGLPKLAIGTASRLTGDRVCKAGYPDPQCRAYIFDRSQDLAFQRNGLAKTPVALNSAYNNTIHQTQFANDGYYGNGSSWIAGSANSWLKLDLGQVMMINRITFGRDRADGFDDRDPGQFKIAVALTDDVYAHGNADNDGTEYKQVVDSAALGFSGTIKGAETIEASFPKAIEGRYVKLTFANDGTDIDEVEVFGAPKPPASIINIDAKQNVSAKTAVVKALPAGTYKVHVISQKEGGAFDAWSLNSYNKGCQADGTGCKYGFEHQYLIRTPKLIKVKRTGKYDSSALALQYAPADATFTLKDDTEVKFYVYNPSSPGNNRGGVSLQVSQD